MPRKKSDPKKKPAPPWTTYPYPGPMHNEHEQGGSAAWFLWYDFLRETRCQQENIFRALERGVLPFFQAFVEHSSHPRIDAYEQILTWSQQAEEGGGPRRLYEIVDTIVFWLVERFRLERSWLLARPWLLGHIFSTIVWWDRHPDERERLAVHMALHAKRRERRFHGYDPTRETRSEAEEGLSSQNIQKKEGESVRAYVEFVKTFLEDHEAGVEEDAKTEGLHAVRGQYENDHMTWLVHYQVQNWSFGDIANQYGKTTQAVSSAVHDLATLIDQLPLRPPLPAGQPPQ